MNGRVELCSEADTIEYSKSGKKKKKIVSKPKKSDTLPTSPSSHLKLSQSSRENTTSSTTSTNPSNSTKLTSSGFVATTTSGGGVGGGGGKLLNKRTSPTPKVSTKRVEKQQKSTSTSQQPNRPAPSPEGVFLMQKRKQFNTMPTELPSTSTSLKISRTNSDDNMGKIKRSASSRNNSSQEQTFIVPILSIDPAPHTTPQLSPRAPNSTPSRVEVEWNKKIQFVDIGRHSLQNLKEIVLSCFGIDTDFVHKMSLSVVLEFSNNTGNTSFEEINEENIQIIRPNGRLRIVFVDCGDESSDV